MYDVIIVGAGPGGLTAAIYTKRAGLSTVVLEGKFPGGQMLSTYEIENYPGIKSISGQQLAMDMSEQVTDLGVEIVYDNAVEFDLTGDVKRIKCEYGAEVEGKIVVLSLGANSRLLGVKGEEEYRGKGVSYCATCDGAFYKDKVACVVGGGNTALEDALYLERFARKVYLVHRRDEFRAVGVLVDRINASNIEVLYDSVVDEIVGGDKVNGMVVHNVKTDEVKRVDIDGIFVAVGQTPNTKDLPDVTMNKGYIVVNEKMETNIKGVYAVGDVVDKGVRQVVTACADGAIAGYYISEYMMHNA